MPITPVRGSKFHAETHLISEIDSNPHPIPIDLGFFLLRLDDRRIAGLSRMIDNAVKATRLDGRLHDATITAAEQSTGITVHCSLEPADEATERLASHCALRKHSQKAGAWLGISLRPDDGSIRFGVSMQFPDEPDEEADRVLRGMRPPVTTNEAIGGTRRFAKIGRNALCPCNSGKKYKRCCIR